MPRGAASVLLATGLISVTTAATRVSQVPLRALAARPQSLAEGRISGAVAMTEPESGSDVASIRTLGLPRRRLEPIPVRLTDCSGAFSFALRGEEPLIVNTLDYYDLLI